jgi:hypothetical protein
MGGGEGNAICVLIVIYSISTALFQGVQAEEPGGADFARAIRKREGEA